MLFFDPTTEVQRVSPRLTMVKGGFETEAMPESILPSICIHEHH